MKMYQKRFRLTILHDASSVLKNARNLTSNVIVRSDLTMMQRECIKAAKVELARLRAEGNNNKTIRFINGMPMVDDLRRSECARIPDQNGSVIL